ncbi:MAG TPA: MaoC/PaaZ C-terminal domain-containing protein [Polyangiaceae bacterium]|nr:MaoC/PaaZ C-terminal domain-containing protein [Polyangiaceae bacterium]
MGTPVPPCEFNVLRVQLLRFCGACSDYTGTHWNERIAKSVGLPDVIAHGTFTIAEAVRMVSDWIGDPGAVLGYEATFCNPVVVPDDDRGAMLHVMGVVEEKLDAKRVVLRLTVKSRDIKVVSGARVTARLS